MINFFIVNNQKSIMKNSDKLAIKFGYRILEGGADNDEVYTFSLFNYLVFGVLIYL
ncbi:hypothetical protein ACFL4A_03140 [bacterium]